MKAAAPPARCASAITCSASVVLPEDSGPKISITRPRGKPPTPRALSSEIDPDGIALTGKTLRDPSRRTDPFPNCFSIWARAESMARWRAPESRTCRGCTSIECPQKPFFSGNLQSLALLLKRPPAIVDFTTDGPLRAHFDPLDTPLHRHRRSSIPAQLHRRHLRSPRPATRPRSAIRPAQHRHDGLPQLDAIGARPLAAPQLQCSLADPRRSVHSHPHRHGTPQQSPALVHAHRLLRAPLHCDHRRLGSAARRTSLLSALAQTAPRRRCGHLLFRSLSRSEERR